MKILILFIMFSSSLFSQNVWEMTEWRAGGVFETLDCIDSNNCFATTRNGRVLYSSNHGESWKILVDEKVVSRTRGWNDNADFIDTNIFFLVNWEGVIFSTRDGGKTFDSLDLRDDVTIHWMKMLNANEGLAFVGISSEDNPRVSFFYTQDSWKSWDTIDNWVNNYKNEEIWYIEKAQINTNNELISLFSGYSYENESGTDYYGKIDLSNLTFSTIFEHKRIIGSNLKINGGYYFSIGKTMTISGGRGNDFIYKFDEKSKKGKPVLEFFYEKNAWGFQDIAFKNDSVGIAVGQFSKICYTYDAGESWYYEQEPNNFIKEENPPRLHVTYAGETAIVADMHKYIFRMTEDNFAPKPQDTLIISGYVLEGDKPQAEKPVELDNRYTMTDSNGYYQFIHIRPGKEYKLRVYNKYYSYTPYLYSPDIVTISTTKDTTINFQANDKRIFHNVSGNVNLETDGLENIPILTIKEIAYHDRVYDTVSTNKDGFFHFDNIEDGFKYTFRPLSDEYEFEPTEYSFATTGDRTGYLFVANPIMSVKSNPNFEFKNNIIFSKEIVGLTYRLIDLQGRVIKSSNLSPTVDFNYLDNGTYILQITKNNSEVFSEKFQVVR